ncbi:phospholipid/cholesterol/gamma-HCH transport system substrate-binding protein [Methylohalomonas lacus]|uniref:Phospholipid/cholesterol/gamma-HCH transport system substrate-binding protein n=1 Tax=Methylohalomonas lacus TaxID=398773 RepID=A0AAE3HH59_9GAMM|nr:outer membrane lipid asymmetry maintenance protein MlaD [Methylohalomonas lacus]MCS3902224.1 phospholipid/cholesterol/gamma-HCH transport system substrate-binding protein [Methylohalomonas lacus]
MLQSKTIEIIVGIFVLLGLAALLMLSMKVSNIGGPGEGSGYKIEAEFLNIGGLKTRAPVKMAGVTIGRVHGISIDEDTYNAVVVMNISNDYKNIPMDTSASIYTAGLLGEQYISLQPGGSETYLAEGDQIQITSDAVVLEEIIGQFMYNQAAGGNEDGGNGGGLDF